ncbi:MAG TPA: NADH-quinone oxidoreductase subunit A [Actinomycetota bacterium]|nr:NADH-quinone oxidoreductase subunit A [Actinomycetota bacterium]
MPAYLPILFLIVLSSLFAVLSMLVASRLAPRKLTPAKLLPYECGIVPESGDERERFPVKFYLVAMLFIVFDIETAFMYPWAVAYDELAMFGLIEMGVFIAILLAAYVYVWKRGGLEWAE